jgi:putative DNA primase/helicase
MLRARPLTLATQRGDTFEDWEKASHEEGGWRWLVRRVRELLEGGGEPPKPGASANPSTPGDVLLVRASDVKLKKYDWLWNSYLVRGKFHVVAGAPSGGKTTLMLKLCAIVSSGGTWPDGTQAKAGKVLIWSSEDDVDDTLAPRLKAMGANLSNVRFLKGIVDPITATRRSFDPATDMPALQRAVQRIGDVSMILIDPVVSFVTGDSHKNAEVRRGLQPLVDLAQECGAALIGISHFTKGTSGRDPVERVTGSLAFGALARVVFAVAKRVDEESHETERIFVRAKSNIGPSDGGFKFTIDQVHLPAPDDMDATAVTWGESLEGTARDLLKEAEGAGESSKTEDAAELIQETMRAKGGEVSANDLRAALKAAGIGRDSGYRAINELLEQHRIARVRYVENGPWTYIFPRRGGVADVSAFDTAANDSATNGDLVGGAT